MSVFSDAPQPVDSETRARALDPARSFCVTAPAGSGKTELLSQRVLRLLANAEQPEDILAITFTRKAAAEMQERIIAALRTAAVEGEPAAAHKRQTWQLARAALQRDAERGWQLLQNPARLRVMTIDGLCASLTRQLPVLSTFGGSVGISDDAETLYREAVQALLAALESAGPIADALADLLLHLDNDSERFQRLLIGLLANRDQWLRHIGTGALPEANIRAALENTLQTIAADALDDATQRLRRYQGDLLPLLDFAAVRLRELDPDHSLAAFAGCAELPGGDAAGASAWRTLVAALLTQSGGWRKKLDKRDGFPVGDDAADKKICKARKENMLALIEAMSLDDGLLEALVQLRHLPTPTYPDAQWRMLWHLMLLLPVAAAQLKVVFQQHGEVDYTEVAQAALNALGDADAPGELMLRLDARIRHILVDEFQDTSSSQFQLLKLLLEGWAEHNALNEDQQTLFIVGDGMQSIYGFRAANVGLFLGARRRGVNDVVLDDCALSVNFRSTPTIVNWVNATFSSAFPQVEKISRGAVPYENSQAFNADRAGSEVRIVGVQGDDERTREAALCVQLAQQALRASDDGEVAILVRNRSHLRAIVPALGAAEIPWRAADIDPLAARTAVMDLLTLFKALSNLADRIAWLALLRSPLVGLDNRDLHAIAGDGVRTVWSSMMDAAIASRVSADGAAALARAGDAIGAAFAQRDRHSPRSWLEGVWFALGGACCLTGDDDWRNLYTLFDLIEQLPAGADITQLETRVATLYAQPRVTDGVRLCLMTIHKSKGLEFDTVIIPGLDKMPRSDDRPLLQWGEYLDRNGREGLVLAAAPAFGGDADAIYDWLDFERKQKQQLEDTRLFYVAATRAVSRLYLLFCDNRTNTEKPFAPASRSLLARIWDSLGDTVEWQAPTPAQISLLDIDTDATADATLTRVPPDWRSPLAPSPEFSVTGSNLPDLAWREETAEIHAGILIHALLEQCAIGGTEHWLQRSVAQRRELVAHLATQRAVLSDLRDAVIDKVVAALDAALADERGRWLFDAAHTEAVAEWDLSLEDGRLIVDRSFVDANDTRWIVDYKTSMPHRDEPLADFYAREAETYRQQLFGYRDAVAAFDARPIRLAIYFPCVPGWCEL